MAHDYRPRRQQFPPTVMSQVGRYLHVRTNLS
jgi:hypothetical protein